MTGYAACWMAGRGPCAGPLQAHHLILQQVIRRELRSQGRTEEEILVALGDERCWRPLCSEHHHRVHHGLNRIRLRREELPAGVEAYAEEHGLVWRLDHDYGPRKVSA